MDWIIHLDTDELLHPAGAREYSLRQLLLDVPGDVDTVIFPNYVSGTASIRPENEFNLVTTILVFWCQKNLANHSSFFFNFFCFTVFFIFD